MHLVLYSSFAPVDDSDIQLDVDGRHTGYQFGNVAGCGLESAFCSYCPHLCTTFVGLVHDFLSDA